jgi:CP family cyanate transporter-like MFS transporter
VRAEIGRSPVSAPVRGAGLGLLIAGILILAFNLRAAITSLPPLFPELHTSMHLSPAGQALLAAIPVLCFGVFSGVAAPLSRAFGEERVLGTALVLLAGGLAMRGAAPGTLLFPGTVLAGGAIALMNVLLPSLVKRRRPERAGLLIGMYLAAMSTGAIIGSLIAVPVYQAAGSGTGAVRITLGLWAVPALIGAAAWLPQLRYRTTPPAGPLPEGEEALLAEPGRSGATAPRSASARHDTGLQPAAAAAARTSRPLWRTALTWQVTLFMGLQSAVYYASLSWFPTMFRDRGVSAVDAGTLLAVMNLGNAVAALLVPVLAHRLRSQQWLSVGMAAALAIGLTGSAFGPVGGSAVFTLVLGLGQGSSLGLAIYFTMARAPDPVTSASLSAFAQSVGYLLASLGPLLVGFLHTATGGWAASIVLLLGVVAVLLASGWLAGRDQTVPALVR